MTHINDDHAGRIAVVQAAHFALKSTCQLYQWTNEPMGLFVANGCVVLFHYSNSYYCFSNAHVLADAQLSNTFFLLRDGISMTVGGDYFFSSPLASENRNDDYLDFAIVKLNENVIEHLINNGHQFLNIGDIGIVPQLSQEHRLLISAFPASKTKLDATSQALKFNPLIATTIPYIRQFKNEHFTSGLHYIAEFPINSFTEISTGQRMRAPNPVGISGSGLWLLTAGREDLTIKPVLIGILSEYHENNAVIVSTKIDVFLEVVRQRFDLALPATGLDLDLIDE